MDGINDLTTNSDESDPAETKGGLRAFFVSTRTVILGRIQGPVNAIRQRFSTNGHVTRPLITAREAETKIERYTAKLIASIETANKQYVANNPEGTYPTIGDAERLLIRSKVGQTVNKCYSIAPEETVQNARQKNT